MIPPKASRHREILRLVRRETVTSQEQLRALLAVAGVRVTQATLSRDLRELGLVKVAGPEGSRYAVPAGSSSAGGIRTPRVLAEMIIAVHVAGAMLVLRTAAGAGRVVARAVEDMGWEEVLGVVADEATVLVVTRGGRAARAVAVRIDELARLSG